MALRSFVGKCSANIKHLISSSYSSYPRRFCSLSNSNLKPIYLPPLKSSLYFTEEAEVSRILAICKRRRSGRKFRFGYYSDCRLDKDDPSICRLAQRVVKYYNKEHNVKLEFKSVLSACQGNTYLETHIMVQACDPLAARVPVKLRAVCVKNSQKRYTVKVLPTKPVPFMSTIDETKYNVGKRKISAYVETLLFANIRKCPIIDKRLGLKMQNGLKTQHGLLIRNLHGYVVKVPLNDDVLLAHAKFALKKQNENQEKGSRLRFLRAVGAWVERVRIESVVYYIMLEALESKVKRRFFAAVESKPINEDLELLKWVVADSPRATMS